MKRYAWVELATGGPFDLAQVLDSGQVFHWESVAWGDQAGYAGCIGDQAVWLAQTGPETVRCPVAEAERVARYLGIDEPIARLHATFPAGDAVLAEAIVWCPGLRLIRQPVWECLATFITSSLKQVAHIRQISLTLRRRYGVPHEVAGRLVHAYPTPGALAEAGEKALRECGLGYRAVGMVRTAAALASGEADLAELEALDDDAAREWLMRFHGVGEKIANCVLLFGCGRYGAFPIDVWMDRILRERYFGPRKRQRIKPRELQEWAERHFGPCAGYAQQYLFHFARKTF
jgi:N-glycosylase/DNA lyase